MQTTRPRHIPKVSLVPGSIPTEELLELCRYSVAPFFDAQPVESPAGARPPAYLHEYHLGKCLFIDTSFPAHTFRRDAKWRRIHDDSDHLLLQTFVSGNNRVINGSHEYTEDGHNLYAVSLAFAVQAESTDSRVCFLVLPRDLVGEAVPHLTKRCGAVFQEKTTGARLFGDHMRSLANLLGDTSAEEATPIVDGTLELLSALSLHGEAHAEAVVEVGFRTACRFIDQHLKDPGLGVESLCKHLRCSRATLYRLFKSDGGVREYIQRRRLIGCFDAIRSPAHRHRRIIELALDFGFASHSHFSNVFRTHFGMTPREARDCAIPLTASSAYDKLPTLAPSPRSDRNEDAEQMLEWAKSIGA